MKRLNSKKTGLSVTALVLLLAAAGCQSGVQSGDNAVAGVDATAPPPPDGKVLQSELRAFCPSVVVREGTAYYSTYAKGGDGDASKVIYQASITDSSRSCTRADGNMTIKVAAAGRVVPGPMVQAGTVTMPIRVVVTQGGQPIYSQLHQYKVQISDTSSATQFVFTDPNVVIPIPPDGQARIFVGYDEGVKKSAE
ncbi:MAG: hypothetical protein AB7P20_22335 [Rhizobiaceae bacterium]